MTELIQLLYILSNYLYGTYKHTGALLPHVYVYFNKLVEAHRLFFIYDM